jgi:hypothetical protein
MKLPLPLSERKAKLATLLARAPVGIVFNEHTDEDDAVVFRHAWTVIAELDLSRFRGEVRSWDQGTWFDCIVSSSVGRSFGSAESIFSSRPARCQGRRVERLSRTAGTLAMQLAITLAGRSLTGAIRAASAGRTCIRSADDENAAVAWWAFEQRCLLA